MSILIYIFAIDSEKNHFLFLVFFMFLELWETFEKSLLKR